ncbi:MAG: hypothetical protein U1E65_22225 [Myxococcota bacterium]
MSRRSAAPLLFLVVACTPPSRLNVQLPALPDSPVYVGAILRAADGSARSSSGLSLAKPGEASFLFPSSGGAETFVDVYLFDAAAIDALRAEIGVDVLFKSPIREAQADEAVLPSPAPFARFDAQGNPLMSPPPPPPITADWLPRCPRTYSAGDVNIDISCAIGGCDARFIQTGCTGKLVTNGVCAIAPVDFEIGTRGDLRPTSTDVFSDCHTTTATLGAFAETTCKGPHGEECALRFLSGHSGLFRAPLEAKVIGPAGQFANDVSRPTRGALTTMALLQDHVMVAVAHDGDLYWRACPATMTNEFIRIDRATKSIDTFAAPHCATTIVENPEDDREFLAGFENLQIGRFSEADGSMLEHIQVSGPIQAQSNIIGFAALPPGFSAPIAAIYTNEEPETPTFYNETYLIPLALNPLRALPAIGPVRGTVFGIGNRGPSGNVSLMSNGVGMEKDYLYEVKTTTIANYKSLRWCNNGGDVSSGHFLAAGDFTVIDSTANVAPAAFVLSGPELKECRRAGFYYFNGDSTALASWPSDPHRVLVAVTEYGTTVRTAIGLLDAPSARFLPRFEEIPGGPISALRADEHGVLWMLQPSTGSILSAPLNF